MTKEDFYEAEDILEDINIAENVLDKVAKSAIFVGVFDNSGNGYTQINISDNLWQEIKEKVSKELESEINRLNARFEEL